MASLVFIFMFLRQGLMWSRLALNPLSGGGGICTGNYGPLQVRTRRRGRHCKGKSTGLFSLFSLSNTFVLKLSRILSTGLGKRLSGCSPGCARTEMWIPRTHNGAVTARTSRQAGCSDHPCGNLWFCFIVPDLVND